MSILTQQALRELINRPKENCVSIAMPTQRSGPETRQNPIRFRNLTDDAERQLIEAGVDSGEIRRLLEPARELQDNYEFWQHQSAGMALFAANDRFQHFTLPGAPQEVAAVGRHFHIVPLLPFLQGNGQFYVLAVSLRKVRLFAGSRDGLSESTPPTLKFDMDEALALDMERQLQMHSHQPGRSGNETGVYHGHEDVDLKKYIRQYFRKIDDAVCDLLSGETAPLVFAGVQYLFPIYGEVNGYGRLAERSVTGNFDDAAARDLHAAAWDIVRPDFDKDRQAAQSRIEEAIGTGLAAADIAELLPAAVNGRIDTLFIQPRSTVWGCYEHESGQLTIDNQPSSKNEELINRLAIETLQHGGRLFAADDDHSFGDSPVAALFRFAAVEQSASVQAAH